MNKKRKKLKKLLKNAYAPYSKHPVASLVITKDNKVFGGVNVENVLNGASICAERNAINRAVAKGYKKGDFKEMYVMAATNKLIFPCYFCRQVITEFFEMEAKLHLVTETEIKTYTMNDIIVHPFTSDDIK